MRLAFRTLRKPNALAETPAGGGLYHRCQSDLVTLEIQSVGRRKVLQAFGAELLYRSTGPEIWEDTKGWMGGCSGGQSGHQRDAVWSGTGFSRKRSQVCLVAVEPVESP